MFETADIVLRGHLDSGERLLWSGKPKSGILLRGSDAFLIPFSILWGGFAIFWETMAITMGAPFFFMLWGIPFVLVGLYIMFGRFIVDAKQRENTYYGVTNNRIIILSGIFQKNIKSLNIKTLQEISVDEKEDRMGTIRFGASNPMYSWLGGSSWPGAGKQSSPGFECIPNARDVYNLIRQSQNT